MNYEGYNSDDSDDRDIFHPLTPKQNVISEILENKLYLTDMFAANDKALLTNRNIKGIISLGGLDEQVHYINHDGIDHHWVYIDDDESEPISDHFDECINFIDSTNGPVLVHCWAGISRSATIVVAYLMRKREMNYKEAIQFVQKRRSFICPNDGFLDQLKGLKMDWDQKWKDNCRNKCGLAVSCKCGGPAGFCECAKKSWIEEQKMNLGEPFDVSLATICYECSNYTFNPITCGPEQLLLCRKCARNKTGQL